VPAGEALERRDELAPDPTPLTLALRCWLVAMLDRVEEARPVALQAHDRLVEQTGQRFAYDMLAEIALLAGDLDDAARHLRTFCDWLEETENYAFLSTYLPQLGRVLCALGRYDEAEPLAQRGRELGDEQDAVTQALWRQVEALVHASRGQLAEAERLAREAVAITYNTDSLLRQGEALCDLADVLQVAGRHDEAAAALRDALDRYERKQIIPLVRRTSERIAALDETPA
jgi:tetratricopeptide (TPR) repeat protein